MCKRKRNRNRRRKLNVSPSSLRKGQLAFSGITTLLALAMGADPNKALEYGIEVLKFGGAKIETESENEDSVFMVGLA